MDRKRRIKVGSRGEESETGGNETEEESGLTVEREKVK